MCYNILDHFINIRIKMKKILLILLLFALLCALVACGESLGEPTAVHKVNGISVEPYETDGVITALKLIDPSGKSSTVKCKGTNFTVLDLNFDGHDDLRLDDAEHSGRYLVWLYQPNSRIYTFNSTLSELTDPVFDSDNGRVTARIYRMEYYSERDGETSGYRETRATVEYEFISGVPIRISESGIYHDSDGELYCVYEAEFADGELVYNYANEKWYYLDELTAEGYKW